MTALHPVQRKVSAKEMAEKLGVSRRTIQRMIAEPREEYLRRVRERADEALRLREEEGLKWREIGERVGTNHSGAYQLAQRAKQRREAEKSE